MYYIKIPSIAENIDNVTIGEWLVRVGQYIEIGAELVVLITEKATFNLELEDDISGNISHILSEERSVLPVGYIIAIVCQENDLSIDVDLARQVAETENENLISTTFSLTDDNGEQTLDYGVSNKVRAVPSARRLAKENDIVLSEVAKILKIKGIIKEKDIFGFMELNEK